MYELFTALKYLIPKKRAISTSVISLVAFIVISLVVWLVLIFLSVTAGLEQNLQTVPIAIKIVLQKAILLMSIQEISLIRLLTFNLVL